MIWANAEYFLVVSLTGFRSKNCGPGVISSANSAAAARLVPVTRARDFQSCLAWLCSYSELAESNCTTCLIIAEGPFLRLFQMFIPAYCLFPALQYLFSLALRLLSLKTF